MKKLKYISFLILFFALAAHANNAKELCSDLKECLSQVSPQTKDLVLEGTDILQKLNQLTKENSKTRKERRNINKEISKLKIEIENICNDIESEAVFSLMIDLSPSLKVLDKNKTMYHWFGDEEVGLVGSIKHAYGWQNLFFEEIEDLDSDYNAAGKGFYAASDPFITMDYGINLIKIDIPKGSKYLDVFDTRYNISSNTLELLKKEGCIIQTGNYFSSNIKINKQHFTSEPKCIPFFKKAFENLDIDFISYNYNAINKNEGFCSKDKTTSAIVAVNLNLTPINITHQTKWDFIHSQDFKDYANLTGYLDSNYFDTKQDIKTLAAEQGLILHSKEKIEKADKDSQAFYKKQNKMMFNRIMRSLSYYDFKRESIKSKEETMDTIPKSKLKTMRDKMFGCN